MPECNIDAKGKAARLAGGLTTLLGAGVLATVLAFEIVTVPFGWYAVVGAIAGGAFAIYEARAGWCVVRAMGIKTPL